MPPSVSALSATRQPGEVAEPSSPPDPRMQAFDEPTAPHRRQATAGALPGRRASSIVRFVLTIGAAACCGLMGTQQAMAEPVDTQPTMAACGPGSKPETGIQGRVPIEDRRSGASKETRSCNLELVGSYRGEGASWVNPSYDHCAYMSSAWPSSLAGKNPGVRVIDATDPRNPKLATRLMSPAAVQGPWESLKVNQKRGLLGMVSANSVVGAAFFSVYDVSEDCAKPKLLNGVAGTDFTAPVSVLNHEGGWSPDGNTYWSSGLPAGAMTAIDVRDPTAPKIAWSGVVNAAAGHGFSISDDGKRLYLSTIPGGVHIYDISDVQDRKPNPQVRFVGSATWADGIVSQASVPFTKNGRRMLVSFDEVGGVQHAGGAVRFVDLQDERKPSVQTVMRLGIQLPKNTAASTADLDGNGIFHYDAHYCTLDRPTDPSTMACGYFNSGIRVFDIRDLAAPREIAYYNPGAQSDRRAELLNSEHASGPLGNVPTLDTAVAGNLAAVINSLAGKVGSIAQGKPLGTVSADWCASPPRFVGTDELWATCQDNGFLALKFTNNAYPIGSTSAAPACISRRTVLRRFRGIRSGARVRNVRATAGGRRLGVRVLGRRSVRVSMKGLPRGTYTVRLTGRVTSTGKVVRSTSRLRTCGAGRAS